jgi:hypothetical protein
MLPCTYMANVVCHLANTLALCCRKLGLRSTEEVGASGIRVHTKYGLDRSIHAHYTEKKGGW